MVSCLLAGFILSAGVIPQDVEAASKRGDKPNVVIMLADNMGYGDLGSYGSGGVLRGMGTPNIDRLADEGLMLTQFLLIFPSP